MVSKQPVFCRRGLCPPIRIAGRSRLYNAVTVTRISGSPDGAGSYNAVTVTRRSGSPDGAGSYNAVTVTRISGSPDGAGSTMR